MAVTGTVKPFGVTTATTGPLVGTGAQIDAGAAVVVVGEVVVVVGVVVVVVVLVVAVDPLDEHDTTARHAERDASGSPSSGWPARRRP